MAAAEGFQLHTRNITDGETFTLDGTEGVLLLSYLLSDGASDAASLIGSMSFKASSDPVPVASEAVAIPPGGGNTFVSDSNNKSLALSITVVTGTLKLIIGF